MRLSRPCYDKPHRCPGWAGGGWKSGRVDHCLDGSIRTQPLGVEDGSNYPSASGWRLGHCVGNRHTGRSGCGTVTIPWNLRYLDPRWWRHGYRFIPTDVQTWFAIRRYERRGR